MTTIATLIAGLVLLAVVGWRLRQMRQAPHAPTGGGGVDPAPESDPSHPTPNAQ